jgi:hypothetical protein
MSQLTKLYQALEDLQSAGLSFNEDLLSQISELEESIIKNDILPVLQDTIQPALSQVKRGLVLVVEYTPNHPISVKLSRKRSFVNELPDVKVIEPDPTVEHKTHASPIATHTKAPKTILRITLPDGKIIEQAKAADALIDFVHYVGVEKVRRLGILRNKIPLVSNSLDAKYASRQKPLGGGWYLMTCTSTNDKKKDIEAIADAYGLKVKVEII